MNAVGPGRRISVAIALVLGATVFAGIPAASADAPLPPLHMVGASNQFGNDPDLTTWPISASSPPATYPGLWATVAGSGTAKQFGDAYAANWCDTDASGQLVTDGCSGAGDGKNLDYRSAGHFFTVDVRASGTIDLQAFDPAFVDVGLSCTASASSANLAAAAALTNVPSYPQGAANTADIAKRYRPATSSGSSGDPGAQYCTGDAVQPNSAGGSVPPATTYRVLRATAPGETTTTAPVAGCAPITYPGLAGDVAVPLAAGTTPPGAPAALATYFRQWVTLCRVSAQPGDEFFIEVSTDSGSGGNQFALRAVASADGSPAAATIAGNGDAAIVVTPAMLLASKSVDAVRVPTAYAGSTIAIDVFDVADTNGEGFLSWKPPADSNVGSSFAGCTWNGGSTGGLIGPSGFSADTPSPPWGAFVAASGCQVFVVPFSPTLWNAQWSTVQIPIPANYTCADADPNGCWITMHYNVPFANTADITTWSATVIPPGSTTVPANSAVAMIPFGIAMLGGTWFLARSGRRRRRAA